MNDSFRAQRAAQQEAASKLEASLSHLTSTSSLSPPSTPPKKSLSLQEQLDEDFRISCGAYVKNRAKPGIRCKYDLESAQSLLSLGANINGRDTDGWTALHWASCEGYITAAKWLLRNNADLDVGDNDGCTALWVTGYNNQYSSAMLLLWGGADVGVKGKSVGTSLCKASIAARSQRNPTVAEAIETEEDLRSNDGERWEKQVRGEGGDFEQYRTDMKAAITAFKTKSMKF
ncbi:hypothetical protein TrVE_jg9479 [Triparma verrucosa]|uniref:Uncharacterized protein n=1 Tax=Triparma verrucosa TaxID=1606542 RepID=A0A9W7F7U2_9STRA|nr:hypothetical protein TrVE_jg9479 [Triparma verrucosa]